MTTSNISVSYHVKPEFSVRMVACDHYLTKPLPGIDVIYSDFRGSDIKQVPVLRVFGPTPDGQKGCLHIHGVFPYFYVPCPTQNPQPQFLYQIAASLDKALNIALKQATSANQHVYKISLVKGLPFYGFHDKDHLYLKVFLYNPGLIKQAGELCSNGAILGQTFQPHESHLNFTLQFFIDFNLFGMSNVDIQSVRFRRSGISQSSNEPLQSPEEYYLKPESICFYEADCMAAHIINRQRVGKGDGIENPGLEEVWNQEKERRKQLNVSMASKSLSQGRIKAEETESHYKFEQMFLVKLSGLIDKPVSVNPEAESGRTEVHYPAESMEGSQLFNAVDVSMHLPDKTLNLCETLRRSLDETLTDDTDITIVDENVALNSSLSLHYSQVLLDSEDLELVDLLQDMDEKPIEEDSVLGTPADASEDMDNEIDDAEYSQVFNEDTILLDHYESKGDADNSNSPTWNDSFWDTANIPQLDGTCDDDHVKKVRKRKMRSFKLGLSRPKSKKKDETEKCSEESASKADDISDIDEINASRETIDSISALHFKRTIKKELHSVVNSSQETIDEETSNQSTITDESIQDLVNKFSSIPENKELGGAETYDLQRNYEPAAGPSNVSQANASYGLNKTMNLNFYNSMNKSLDSSPEDNKLGIVSFYDKSKIFDTSDFGKNESFHEHKHDNSTDHDSLTSSAEEIDIATKSILSFRKNNMPSIVLTPRIRPPTNTYVISTLGKYNISNVKNPEPFFSDPKDVGDKVEIGQMLLKLHSKLARDQTPFEKVLDTTSIQEWRQLMFLQSNEMCEDTKPEALKTLLAANRHCILEPIARPPTKSRVLNWLKGNNESVPQLLENEVNHAEISNNNDELDNSQALGLNEDVINSSISLETNDKDKVTLNETSLQVTMQPDGSFLCFGNNETHKEKSLETPSAEVDFLTVMLLEVHASVREDLHPDPLLDHIQAIFFTVTNDCPSDHFLSKTTTEIIVVDNKSPPKYLDRCVFNVNVTYVNSENEIIEKVIELVKKHDPDIMCGYEIEMNSWGYILERAHILGLEMVKEVSRITEKSRQKRCRNEENDFEGRVIGRIMFNVWRLFRHELALSSYSFENCMYAILKERVPKFSFAQLAKWWNDESRILRWRPVEYYLTRLSGTVRMLEKLDIINRTSELARLFGMQWWEVLSRGSQFRVESLMLRAARPLNLVALSPTVKQRAAMRAPECLPLIFEPVSRFYSDPVIVLDFQSLYPSMMIAYNYCFSTCIGRVQNINGDSAYEFGAWRLRISKSKLETLVANGLVHWSPVGVGFVKASLRRGVLPALLRRILAARQAVKKGMKLQTDEAVKKAMHSRQLGLKLIANVTYGYTAANYSGRMPCVEVADSVVSKGRETLERAIKLVKSNKQWNAKVVYGDTDSMFVQVPGGTRAEAFAIGQQIADAVTADNPSPVALKLEKVYQPCILQTKKRYVGYMYETPDQEKPVYEAKGIETVRRDGCPAGVKLLQRALCELFDHGDMSRVKRGVMSVLSRLADGSLPPQELFFTREYHGPAGYRPGAAAPPNEIAKRIAIRDRRAVPRTGERVSWLVVAGAPGAALVRLARSPAECARRVGCAPHVPYYAARALLPPLHRCLALLGADVFKWWSELGYTRESQPRTARGGIARYLWRERCGVCGARGASALCGACAGGQRATAAVAARLATACYDMEGCRQICDSCCGHAQAQLCENTECPALWRRLAAGHKLLEAQDIATYLPTNFTDGRLYF